MANIIIRPELKQFVLSILQVGYEKCDSKHFYGPCKRGIYVLHVVVNGRGIFCVNGKEAEIRKGDLFLVPPKEVTFYRADAEDPYEYYWFAFQGSNVRELLINAGFLKDEIYVQHAENLYETFRDEMAQLMALGQSSSRNDLFLVSGFYRLLAALTPELPRQQIAGYDSVYEQINCFLEVNYMNNISMDVFSFYTGLHRSSIYRFFKREYGRTPTEYIQDFRLGKAYSILMNSDMSVKSVALSCGFNDMSHFTRLFRKKYSMSPGALRRLKG